MPCHAFAVSWSAHVALDDVSATIQPGMITGLVGPDGAGKTTLLRLIAGLLRPEQGRIIVLGHDMATDAAAAHRAIGYMPQRFGLYEDLSVAENLDLFADLHAMSAALRAERIARLLQFTGLGPFTAASGRTAFGGHEAEARIGLCTAGATEAAAARRAFGRRRPRIAARVVGDRLRPCWRKAGPKAWPCFGRRRISTRRAAVPMCCCCTRAGCWPKGRQRYFSNLCADGCSGLE